MHNHHEEYAMVYEDEIEDKIDVIMGQLKIKYPNVQNPRWHAIKLLEIDQQVTKHHPLDLDDVIDRSYEKDIIN